MAAWQELTQGEYEDVWSRFEARFQFRPSTRAADWPGMLEPAPSATYRFEFPVAEADIEELHDAALAAFRECTAPEEKMYVLDWQHPAYSFSPHVPIEQWESRGTRSERWLVPVLPDGDYYIFLERNFAWGSFGHPWEQTICIFGADLLRALSAAPRLLRDPIRRR